MLTPVPMLKVAVVGAKTVLAETIETLHRLHLLHIEDYTAQDGFFTLGSPLPTGSKVAERLVRIRGVMKGAQMEPPKDARRFAESNLRALEGKLQEVEDELVRLVDERSQALDEVKRLEEEEAQFRRIQAFPFSTRLLSGYQSVSVATGFVDPDADLSALRSVDPSVEIAESEEAEGTFVAVFAAKDLERSIQDALAKLQFQPIEVPVGDASPRTNLDNLERRKAEAQERAARLEEKIGAIRERHAAAFFALDEYLAIEADKATAPVRFRTSANSFMIEGWIPGDAFHRLQNALLRPTASRVFIARLDPRAAPDHAQPHDPHEGEAGHAKTHHEEEAPPVALKNTGAAAPYELLTDTYSRPKYREMDPTLFLYIGFPIFYGLMLGDIGYGLVLLAMVVFGVFNKVYQIFGFNSRWHLNRIFVHCSVSSILFGFLYGEFFGIEFIGPGTDAEGHATEAWIVTPPVHVAGIEWPLSRFHNVKLLLALALLIGAIHIFVGLILGLRNAKVAHGTWDAIKHRGSWLLILLAVVAVGIPLVPSLLGLGSVSYGPLFQYVSLGLFLLGCILLVLGEGATGLLELPTILSNLLSYTRLVAIGLSGAGIALAGNEVAKLAFHSGGATGLVLGILILAVFHLINLGLGIIGPALHSLRLHYVEFFTKFYEGGGTPYQPFGAYRKFTTKEVKQA